MKVKKIFFLLICLLVLSTGCAGKERRNIEEPEVEKKQLGINLEWAEDWSKVEIFNDLAMQCRVPGNVTTSTWANPIEPKKDNNGNILEDFYIVLYAGRNPEPKHTYLNVMFKCNSENPTMTFDFFPNSWDEENGVSRLLTLTKDETTKIWTARYFLRQGVTQIIMSFRNLGGFCSDIHIFREDADINQKFNPQYMELTKGYNCYRFMELTKCNNSTEVKWENRTKPNEIAQGNRGIAWEYVAEFCNQQKGDAWINIPHMADDNYVRQLAKLMKDKLIHNQKIYVEYSNEMWNGMFKQTSWINAQAYNEVKSGNMELDYDGISSDMYIWAQRYNARRCRQISKIFEEVWDKKEINKRVRVVIGGWGAVYNHSKMQMEFLEKTYPDEPVSSYIYGIATGSYYGEGEITEISTINGMFEAFNQDIENREKRYNYKAFKELADSYGVKNLIYEGGVDIQRNKYLTETATQTSMMGVFKESKMEDTVKSILSNWYKDSDNGLFMWYKASVGDVWGYAETIDDTESNVQKGLRSFLE